LQLRLIAAALPLLLCAFGSANAQTADELIAKNLAARGGSDKLAAIHVIVTKGQLRFPGDFKLAYKETRERLDAGNCAIRVDAALQGLTVVQAYDGKDGWRINPFEGRKDAEHMGRFWPPTSKARRSITSAGRISTARKPTSFA
jgi:hypothetical protein